MDVRFIFCEDMNSDEEFLWVANKKSVLSPEYSDKDNSHLLLKRLYLRNNVHIDGRHGFFS